MGFNMCTYGILRVYSHALARLYNFWFGSISFTYLLQVFVVPETECAQQAWKLWLLAWHWDGPEAWWHLGGPSTGASLKPGVTDMSLTVGGTGGLVCRYKHGSCGCGSKLCAVFYPVLSSTVRTRACFPFLCPKGSYLCLHCAAWGWYRVTQLM